MSDKIELPADIDHTARIVMLTYGRMKDGTESYWCYVSIIPSEYDRFMGLLKSGKLDLTRLKEEGFGDVLVSGPGLYPPTDVTKQVAKASGIKIRDLFGEVDPHTLLTRKIAEMKAAEGSKSED